MFSAAAECGFSNQTHISVEMNARAVTVGYRGEVNVSSDIGVEGLKLLKVKILNKCLIGSL